MKKNDSSRSNPEESNGLVEHQKKKEYDVFKSIRDVKSKVLLNSHDEVRTLIGVCKSFPKTSETSYLSPQIENYIKDSEKRQYDTFLRDKQKEIKTDLCQKKLFEAVKFFARRLLGIENSGFIDFHKEKLENDPQRIAHFRDVGSMSENDAFCCAFVLSFYTGLNYNTDKSGVFKLTNHDSNGDEHYSTIKANLLQAINTIPYYWGNLRQNTQPKF